MQQFTWKIIWIVKFWGWDMQVTFDAQGLASDKEEGNGSWSNIFCGKTKIQYKTASFLWRWQSKSVCMQLSSTEAQSVVLRCQVLWIGQISAQKTLQLRVEQRSWKVKYNQGWSFNNRLMFSTHLSIASISQKIWKDTAHISIQGPFCLSQNCPNQSKSCAPHLVPKQHKIKDRRYSKGNEG